MAEGNGGGSGTVSPPEMSAEEKALLKQQTALLEKAGGIVDISQAQVMGLQPWLYEAAGFTPTFSDVGTYQPQLDALLKQRQDLTTQLSGIPSTIPGSGGSWTTTDFGGRTGDRPQQTWMPSSPTANPTYTALTGQLADIGKQIADINAQIAKGKQITGFTRTPNPQTQRFADITSGFMDRLDAALRGDLPVNPALLRDLNLQEGTFNEALRKQLGPGYETSDAGIRSLRDFRDYTTSTLENSRRADLQQSFGNLLSAKGIQEGDIDALLNRAGFVSGLPMRSVSGLTGVSAGYSNPLAAYAKDRETQTQAAYFNASQPSSSSNMFGPIATLAGMAAFSPGKPWWIAG